MRFCLPYLLSYSVLFGSSCMGGFVPAHKEQATPEQEQAHPMEDLTDVVPAPSDVPQAPLPEQEVAAGTERFAPLDENDVSGPANALLGYAGMGNAPFVDDPVDIVVRSRTFECLGRSPRAASAPRERLTLTNCAENEATKFVFRADRHIEVHSETAPQLAATAQCLAAAEDGSVQIELCGVSPRQQWGASRYLLQNAAEKTCLTRHDGSTNGAAVALKKCQSDNAAQSWSYGNYKRAQALAKAMNPNFPESRINRLSPPRHVLVGFSAGNSFPVLGRDLSVALRQGLDQCVAHSGRRGAVNLSRCEDTRRLVFQADGHIETAERIVGGLPLCLAANSSAGVAPSPLYLTACAEEDQQRWAVSGHNLQNSASKACLASQVANYDGDQPAMQPCEATDVAQAWGFGELEDLRGQAATAQASYTVDQLCAVQVALFRPAGQDAEVDWLSRHFGGDSAAFARALEAQGALACKAMFDNPAEVQVLPPVAVSFTNGEYAGAASTYPYPHFMWSRTPGRWTKYSTASKFPEVVAVHEMAHLFDRRAIVAGKNKSTARKFLVEGYADWVVSRAGTSIYTPERGGSWMDGYETSSFFMLWLDDNYGRKKPGDWLTDEMNLAAQVANPDPNWLLSWITTKTGSSMEELWQKYQAQMGTARVARQVVPVAGQESMGSAHGGVVCGDVQHVTATGAQLAE